MTDSDLSDGEIQRNRRARKERERQRRRGRRLALKAMLTTSDKTYSEKQGQQMSRQTTQSPHSNKPNFKGGPRKGPVSFNELERIAQKHEQGKDNASWNNGTGTGTGNRSSTTAAAGGAGGGVRFASDTKGGDVDVDGLEVMPGEEGQQEEGEEQEEEEEEEWVQEVIQHANDPGSADSPLKSAEAPKYDQFMSRRNKRHRDMERRVKNIYRKYNPEKLDQIDTILSHFKGKEQGLIHELYKKYDIPPEFDCLTGKTMGMWEPTEGEGHNQDRDSSDGGLGAEDHYEVGQADVSGSIDMSTYSDEDGDRDGDGSHNHKYTYDGEYDNADNADNADNYDYGEGGELGQRQGQGQGEGDAQDQQFEFTWEGGADAGYGYHNDTGVGEGEEREGGYDNADYAAGGYSYPEQEQEQEPKERENPFDLSLEGNPYEVRGVGGGFREEGDDEDEEDPDMRIPAAPYVDEDSFEREEDEETAVSPLLKRLDQRAADKFTRQKAAVSHNNDRDGKNGDEKQGGRSKRGEEKGGFRAPRQVATADHKDQGGDGSASASRSQFKQERQAKEFFSSPATAGGSGGSNADGGVGGNTSGYDTHGYDSATTPKNVRVGRVRGQRGNNPARPGSYVSKPGDIVTSPPKRYHRDSRDSAARGDGDDYGFSLSPDAINRGTGDDIRGADATEGFSTPAGSTRNKRSSDSNSNGNGTPSTANRQADVEEGALVLDENTFIQPHAFQHLWGVLTSAAQFCCDVRPLDARQRLRSDRIVKVS